MTALYCYGILNQTTTLPIFSETMDGDGPVKQLNAGRYTALVSETSRQEIAPRRRFVKSHTRVLEVAGAATTILPMRFGTIACDEDALAAAIVAREDDIEATMSRVDGHVEYGIRAGLPFDALVRLALDHQPSIATRHRTLTVHNTLHGSAQIEFGRQVADAVETQRRRLAKRFLESVDDVTTEMVRHPPEGDDEVLRADVLIERNAVEDLAGCLERLSEDTHGGSCMNIRLVGPAPLYGFVSLTLPLPESTKIEKEP